MDSRALTSKLGTLAGAQPQAFPKPGEAACPPPPDRLSDAPRRDPNRPGAPQARRISCMNSARVLGSDSNTPSMALEMA